MLAPTVASERAGLALRGHLDPAPIGGGGCGLGGRLGLLFGPGRKPRKWRRAARRLRSCAVGRDLGALDHLAPSGERSAIAVAQLERVEQQAAKRVRDPRLAGARVGDHLRGSRSPHWRRLWDDFFAVDEFIVAGAVVADVEPGTSIEPVVAGSAI